MTQHWLRMGSATISIWAAHNDGVPDRVQPMPEPTVPCNIVSSCTLSAVSPRPVKQLWNRVCRSCHHLTASAQNAQNAQKGTKCTKAQIQAHKSRAREQDCCMIVAWLQQFDASLAASATSSASLSAGAPSPITHQKAQSCKKRTTTPASKGELGSQQRTRGRFCGL